ncbi:hypothetical protein IGB42_02605 [Andreprevotia sp. IGB-42]|uniref:HNH endonuclease signature motif containing protein n=1 Tax=Andreprevotia sp. IGB-42 TaxID=2497473 RepID=UPI00157E5952|nr:HNH endonuclease signature motif containing protein [Andreprevotia sp. IGB-42]KAF0812762.1 hypothetical protein IGB42_02605 [Andreprevotia sp. IGB-42]
MAKRKQWTARQTYLLRELYPEMTAEDLVSILGHSKAVIYGKANALGLKKSEAFHAGPRSGRTDGLLGSSFRFQKGSRPWNKGTKGLQLGGEATQFKKGHRPHTWRPIGSERVTKEGYVEVKLRDSGTTRFDYVSVHHLVWELHHGPIPEGHAVCFKDRNPMNHHPDNLELLTKRELMLRNTVHNLPPEIVTAVQLRGALIRKINNWSKKNG